MQLATESNITAFNVYRNDGTIGTGRVADVAGVDLAVVDKFNTNRGADGIIGDGESGSIAAIANTRVMKAGFHRQFRVDNLQVPGQLYSALVVSFRWAQNVTPGISGVQVIQDL